MTKYFKKCIRYQIFSVLSFFIFVTLFLKPDFFKYKTNRHKKIKERLKSYIFNIFEYEMTKKTNISLVLLLVFSFMLVHNIIPHQHYDEISDIDHHEHDYHHEHDHDKQDHDSENKEPIGLFTHPNHIVASDEFSLEWNQGFHKTQSVKEFSPLPNLILTQITIPKKWEPPNYIYGDPLHFFYFSNSLRGPPVFFI